MHAAWCRQVCSCSEGSFSVVESEAIPSCLCGKDIKAAVTFWQVGGFKISLGLLSQFSEEGLGLLNSQCLEYFSNVCQLSCTLLINVKSLCQEMARVACRSVARKLSTPGTLGVFKLWSPGSIRTPSASTGVPEESGEFATWPTAITFDSESLGANVSCYIFRAVRKCLGTPGGCFR